MLRDTTHVLRILLVALLASTFTLSGGVQASDVNATRIDELVSLYHEYGFFDGTVLVAENKQGIEYSARARYPFSNCINNEVLHGNAGDAVGRERENRPE